MPGDDWTWREIEMKADIAALLAEVRRLTPAPKVARAPAAKVAVWGPVRGMPHVTVLRVNGRARADVRSNGRMPYYARIDGKPTTPHATELAARARIEAWARGKGCEVRDA